MAARFVTVGLCLNPKSGLCIWNNKNEGVSQFGYQATMRQNDGRELTCWRCNSPVRFHTIITKFIVYSRLKFKAQQDLTCTLFLV